MVSNENHVFDMRSEDGQQVRLQDLCCLFHKHNGSLQLAQESLVDGSTRGCYCHHLGLL